MIKIRRSTPITACKKLDGNDIYPLINFSWIMVAFAFVFVFLLSEVSADPRIYRSKYTLSLKGVHFFQRKNQNLSKIYTIPGAEEVQEPTTQRKKCQI